VLLVLLIDHFPVVEVPVYLLADHPADSLDSLVLLLEAPLRLRLLDPARQLRYQRQLLPLQLLLKFRMPLLLLMQPQCVETLLHDISRECVFEMQNSKVRTHKVLLVS
jgi:hypothetical protein